MHRKTARNAANQSLKLNGFWERISKIGDKNFHLEYSTGKIGLPSTFKTFPRCPSGIFPICAFVPLQRVRPGLIKIKLIKDASPFPSILDHQRLDNSQQSVSLKKYN